MINFVNFDPDPNAPPLTLADLDAILGNVKPTTHIVMSKKTYLLVKRLLSARQRREQLRRGRFAHMTNRQFSRILTGRVI